VHYPAIADMLDAKASFPVHAGVANAVGAVVGQVRETVTIASSPNLTRAASPSMALVMHGSVQKRRRGFRAGP
jgi:hypothetical protein